jgi:hypothetical protein
MRTHFGHCLNTLGHSRTLECPRGRLLDTGSGAGSQQPGDRPRTLLSLGTSGGGSIGVAGGGGPAYARPSLAATSVYGSLLPSSCRSTERRTMGEATRSRKTCR